MPRPSLLLLAALLSGGASACELDDKTAPDCEICFSQGDRLRTGACPVGETCSSSVPGLWFEDARLGDFDIFQPHFETTAVGGTQRIGLWRKPELQTFADAFTAQIAAPFAIAGSDDDHVTVRAAAAGTAALAIRDGGGGLDDRISIDAQPIDHVLVTPDRLDDSMRPWAWHVSAARTAVVKLFAADGTRLVDDSLTLSGSAVPAPDGPDGARPAWDTFTLADVSTVHTLELAVATGDGVTRRVAIPVIATVDDIEALDPDLEASQGELTVTADGRDRSYCFVGVYGPSRVVGGHMQISAGGALAAGHASGECLAVKLDVPGDGTITVTLDGHTRRFTIHVLAR